jgi:hypothetical protein
MSAVAVGGNSDLADQTRRQLDELESLLGRMLDIPVIQVDAETLDARLAFATNRRPPAADREGDSNTAAPPSGNAADSTDQQVTVAAVNSPPHALASRAETQESYSFLKERSPGISKSSIVEPFKKYGLEGPGGDESNPPPPTEPPSEVLPWQPFGGLNPSPSLLQTPAPHIPSFSHADSIEATPVHDEPRYSQAAMPEEGAELQELHDQTIPRNPASEVRLILGVVGVCLWIIALSWALVEWMGWTS